VATILTIAITLIAGAAVFSFVNSQAGVSEKQYGQSVGGVVNQIQEKFVVFDLSFPAANQISVWIYNTGQTTLQIASIRVYNSTAPTSKFNLIYNYTTTGQTKTDYVYDLTGTSACKKTATTLESPTISSISKSPTGTQLVTLTVPAAQSGCKSYGSAPFKSGYTYSVTVLGIYGNAMIASQVK
jgi:hypothetical protein